MSDKRTKPSATATGPSPPRRRWRAAWPWWLAASLLVLGGSWLFADWWHCLPADSQATYVGRQTCLACHQKEFDLWTGSHHDLAMDRATPETVLGDFNDAELEVFGIRSRMFRRDGKFWVHTEGEDGKLANFEVKYVFGVTPLQNYMVEFDRPADLPEHEIARLQVLRITWDTLKKRWFYLPPPDVRDQKLAPTDELHWTGIAQRWNNMCADCHSTNLQKNFDVATKSYRTTFSEIDVSCEACHGPASLHVEIAERRRFWDRRFGYGLPRLKDNQQAQIETCAPCHSRRGVIYPRFRPGDKYQDFFASELLRRETYHADGQIQDEDYEYASFLQSKMYSKGIKCSDCHDPHSMRIRYPGNAVCTTCHQHPAGKYDSPSHHHHQPGSTGASCTACHMPKTTYMEVDPRLDHSLRNPRPDLSVELGTPNACTWCHLDEHRPPGPDNYYWGDIESSDRPRSASGAQPGSRAGHDAQDQQVVRDHPDLIQYLDWVLAARRGDQAVKAELARLDGLMLKAVREWYGDRPPGGDGRKRHFAYALDAARHGRPEAEDQLISLLNDGSLPAIVRATAALELGQYGGQRSSLAVQRAAADPDAQVRAAAVPNLLGRLSEDQLIASLLPRLQDPVRAVRIEAGRALAGVPADALRGSERERLQAVLQELRLGLACNNDRAGSHMALGTLWESLGEDERAVEAYQAAIRVEPTVTGPRMNLAAAYDRLAEGRERDAARWEQSRPDAARAALEQAAEYRQRSATARREELGFLARDVGLLPESAALQYRYGMLLYLHRRFDEAEKALTVASRLEPSNPQFLLGLVLFYKERNLPQQALPLAEKLLALGPENEMHWQLLAEIRQALGEREAAGRGKQPGSP